MLQLEPRDCRTLAVHGDTAGEHVWASLGPTPIREQGPAPSPADVLEVRRSIGQGHTQDEVARRLRRDDRRAG